MFNYSQRLEDELRTYVDVKIKETFCSEPCNDNKIKSFDFADKEITGFVDMFEDLTFGVKKESIIFNVYDDIAVKAKESLDLSIGLFLVNQAQGKTTKVA